MANATLHLLFGDEAIEILESDGIDSLCKAYDENEIGLKTHSIELNPENMRKELINLLEEFEGMYHYYILSDEELRQIEAV